MSILWRMTLVILYKQSRMLTSDIYQGGYSKPNWKLQIYFFSGMLLDLEIMTKIITNDTREVWYSITDFDELQ
jgi:hypothetical protein